MPMGVLSIGVPAVATEPTFVVAALGAPAPAADTPIAPNWPAEPGGTNSESSENSGLLPKTSSSSPGAGGAGGAGGSDGGDACYVRFMARVRSALGQFYGSVRSALGHVMSRYVTLCQFYGSVRSALGQFYVSSTPEPQRSKTITRDETPMSLQNYRVRTRAWCVQPPPWWRWRQRPTKRI